MSKYQGAAKRRAKQGRTDETQGMPVGRGELAQIQQLIGAEQESPRTQSPGGEDMSGLPGAIPQMFPEFGEAINKWSAGIDEPGPPQEIVRRMKRQRALQSIQPDVADLAARYGVLGNAQ